MVNQTKKIIDNLGSTAKVLFEYVSPVDVFQKKIIYDAIPCNYIANLFFENQDRSIYTYSRLESEYMFEAVSDYIGDRDEVQKRVSRRHYFNVFDVLSELVTTLLLKRNDVVLCKYSELRQWRNLTRVMGEEIPVTAMYVLQDLAMSKKERKHYAWDFVTRQNNEQINRMLEKGISDHHYHLGGSAPYFQISWLNLMNHTAYTRYTKRLQELDQKDLHRRQRKVDIMESAVDGLLPIYDNFQLDSCEVMHLQAALIRLYLCMRLTGTTAASGVRSSLYCRISHVRIWQLYQDMTHLLMNPHVLMMERDSIESMISSLLDSKREEYVDYALFFCNHDQMAGYDSYEVFQGERWFMYSMMRDIYRSSSVLTREEHNLFYLYLLIQCRIRAKMVQTNDRVGFDNFQQYQNTKRYFTFDTYSEKMINQLAIREPLIRADYFRELEVRITPQNTANDIRNHIIALDNAVCNNSELKELLERDYSDDLGILKGRYYYVFHFPKRKDDGLEELLGYEESSNVGLELEYRHYGYRKKLERASMAIVEFREQFPEVACRVKGIDACSQEIGCRPEVFAPIFRMLSHHTSMMEVSGKQKRIPKLGKTYHVGEDFLDILDGLRAIDEAIRFLNMDCGDRLGHAIALGIDPESWYQSKNYQITMPIQDYIDNLAWLYHVIQRYDIKNQELLQAFIENRFDFYFRTIYSNYMNETDLKTIMEAGVASYSNDEAKRNYKVHKCMFRIDEYYRAWSLRGDHPDLYKKGYYDGKDVPIDLWENYMTNRKYPRRFETRYIPECSLLYYYYHYNKNVKREGSRKITVDVQKMYIDGVIAAQKALQQDIASRGISIETNPTSNIMINGFGVYEKHPILTFYNKGLVHTKEEVHNCPQIHVSINTDDQGVFFTCIENEYALIASAMEQVLDEDGKPLYKKDDVIEWLDNIREMGNLQGFRDEQ